MSFIGLPLRLISFAASNRHKDLAGVCRVLLPAWSDGLTAGEA